VCSWSSYRLHIFLKIYMQNWSQGTKFRRSRIYYAKPQDINCTTSLSWLSNGFLLPPIQLYRRLLRAHRRLSVEMRILGDDYIKSEFRRVRKTDNPLHIIGFLSQWCQYLDELNGDPSFRGRKLEPEAFEKLSSEQIGQLNELMLATREIYTSPIPSDHIGEDWLIIWPFDISCWYLHRLYNFTSSTSLVNSMAMT